MEGVESKAWSVVRGDGTVHPPFSLSGKTEYHMSLSWSVMFSAAS